MYRDTRRGTLDNIVDIPLTADRSWVVSPLELENLHATQNMTADHKGGEHLLKRRRAMSTVIHYCSGVGVDVGCQWNKITPTSIGIEYNDEKYLTGPWGANMLRDGADLSIFTYDSLDYIFAGHMLEDIWDPIGCLKAWIRTVKSGGHIALITPHASYYPRIGTEGCNPEHKFDYWPAHMATMINSTLDKYVEIVQLETYCNKLDFDLVMRIK